MLRSTPPSTPHRACCIPAAAALARTLRSGLFINSDPRALRRSTFPALLFCLLRSNSSGEGQTARVTAAAAGRVGGVCCAGAAESGSPHPQSSGAGLPGGRGRTDGPRRDGGCGCSARVLWVGRLHRDHRCPGPLGLLLEMLFLSVSCFSVRVARPPQRRSHPGEEEGAGPSRTVWSGEGRARGSWPAALWSPPPFGNVDPRLRSMFQFHAGSWESWCCCCCLIPGDRPWDRGRRWRLEMADTRSVHETRFEAAVKVIQSLPKNGTCTWAPLKKPPAEARGPSFLNPTSLNLLSASGLAYLTYLFSSLISACT